MDMCQTTMESSKIVSNECYLSSNTNATNCHFLVLLTELKTVFIKSHTFNL